MTRTRRTAAVVALGAAALALGLWLALRDDGVEAPQPPAGGFEARLLALPQGEAIAECEGCPELVAVPAGAFLMGSPASEEGGSDVERPRREVTVERFAIGRAEVTFDQWEACVADGYCRSNPTPSDEGWGRGDRPVIHVSWDDVAGEGGFLDWLNSKTEGDPYRLPTEAEWEYAARAGTTGPFGFDGPISTDRANYDGDRRYAGSPAGVDRGQTVPAGSFPPNGWGVHDMHGNVWEHVQDCWHDDYRGAPTDGSAWMAADGGECARAVLRGGSWADDPLYLRAALRSWGLRDERSAWNGFRVVRTL